MRAISLFFALLAGCSGSAAPVCGAISGALTGEVRGCVTQAATYSAVTDTTLLAVAGDGTSPVAAVELFVTVKGRPDLRVYRDGDVALGFAQLKIDTDRGAQYSADFSSAEMAGTGHLAITVVSVQPSGEQYLLHGRADAQLLDDPQQAAAFAAIDF